MNRTISTIIQFLCLGIVLFSCDCKVNTQDYTLTKIPDGFPEIAYPTDNNFSIERWTLGKKLFYDPILSIDSSVSCASCHKQEYAFADNLPKTPGVFDRAGKRNAPTLTNVAYLPHVLFEGSVPTLEMQILVPIQEHNEFNHNIVAISNALNEDESYVDLSLTAYNRKIDPFVITRAISNFQRTLISGNSAFDKYEYQNKPTALNESQKRGHALFFSNKTNCFECHSGPFFTDFSFKNNGLKSVYEDEGRYHFTGKTEDLNTFKVPTLRNVEVTAPYMHDGSFPSLEAVVEHYNSGGFNHQNKNEFVKPLLLSEQEKTDLINFLKSLTDWEFIQNPVFQP
ncbi:MAG: cytochrome-c peroxidase [Flavobacteriales bacterium]